MPPKHDENTRDAGLIALIVCGNNAERASQELAENGHQIAPRTLRDWRNKHHDRYEELRRHVAPKVMEEVADDSAALLRRLIRMENAALDRLEAEIPEMKGADAARALQQLAVSKGINTEKVLLVRGQPTQIIEETGDADQIIARLARRLGLDSRAEAPELPPGQPWRMDDASESQRPRHGTRRMPRRAGS
jgi:transposase-like protein